MAGPNKGAKHLHVCKNWVGKDLLKRDDSTKERFRCFKSKDQFEISCGHSTSNCASDSTCWDVLPRTWSGSCPGFSIISQEASSASIFYSQSAMAAALRGWQGVAGIVARQRQALPSTWLAVRCFADRRVGVVKMLDSRIVEEVWPWHACHYGNMANCQSSPGIRLCQLSSSPSVTCYLRFFSRVLWTAS